VNAGSRDTVPLDTVPLDTMSLGTVSLGTASLGTVLSVWAHPDDETYLSGGVMAACAAAGARVVCVSATAGEHGTADPTTWPPARLAARRRDEFAAAMEVLGVREHHVLGFEDGTLDRVGAHVGTAAIAEIVADVRPDTILTFGPDGMTYHPDHLAVGRWTTAAWHRSGGRGRLLHATATTDHYVRFGRLYETWQMYMTDERPTGHRLEELALRVVLDGAALDRKLEALAAITSQTSDLIATIDPATWRTVNAEEAFVATRPG
jgi:LmbE family N-acetylglucosaminyl deacetylase